MICDLYRERRDAMMAAFDKYFPKSVRHTFPDGGMFTWVTCPEGLDTTAMLKEANERKVAYVPGEGFYVEGAARERTVCE